ncbi:glycosyltransferase family 2 protein [Halomicrobium salinisoli]|uniref:glycosyltransferase family 2 protein n=1 Tax=Halomicrobium salinisoli TaxID=2878391 RepID=UPI001CF0053D|nr:glycosyltransferase family A protein [Halomicrobium salinisoli]
MGPSDRPLVTVVVPTYDRPALLSDAVRSVVDQTYDAIELIVVDDGSDADPTAALAEVPLDGLVDHRVLQHDDNEGANAARNTGVRAASGEYVAFLDDDDYWKPEKTARQVAALEEAPEECAIAFTGQQRVDDDGAVTGITRPVTDGDFLANLARGASFGTFSTVLVRRSVFDEVGYLDERFPCWQDRDWYLTLAPHVSWTAVPEPLTVRQFTRRTQISDGLQQKRDVAYPLLLEKHRAKVAELGRSYERRFLATLCRGLAVSAADNDRHRAALRYLLRAIRLRPSSLGTYGYFLALLGGKYTWIPAQASRRAIARTLRGPDVG